jgi:hypothetical protein
VHPPFGADFDSRFSSREERKERKEREGKSFYGFSSPSLEEDSSVMGFGPLRVLRGFA